MTAYPPSFGDDVEAYIAHLAGGDLFDETGCGPASSSTLRDVRFRIFQMAAALVHSGRPPMPIQALADIVEPEAIKVALTFFWSRNGKRASKPPRRHVATLSRLREDLKVEHH